MSKISMVRVTMIKTGNVEIGRRRVVAPDDGARIIRTILKNEYQGGMPDREVFGVIFLDTKNQVNGAEFVAVGTVNSALVHPREVYKAAILHNASSIIVFHNHPSGDCTPSSEDVMITKRLQAAGEVVGIELLDHVVLGDHTFTSLKQRGLF